MAKRITALAMWALAACLLSGCSSTFPQVRTYEVPPGQAIGVDIENSAGRVEVRAGEQYETITVDAARRVAWGPKREKRQARAEEVSLVQSAVEEGPGGRLVLRVRAESLDPRATDHSIDLRVTLPRVDGARVRNSGGVVELVGVGGALQIESGDHIVVRTDRALDEPVALVTERGNVYLQSPPGTRGRIELESEEGDVEISSAESIQDVLVRPGMYHGVLNGGVNPILIRTGKGDVRLLVREDVENILRFETARTPLSFY